MLANKLCVTQLRIRPPSHLQHRVTGYFSPDNVPDPLPRPSCHQIYNMFYPSDPSAVRLETIAAGKVPLRRSDESGSLREVPSG